MILETLAVGPLQCNCSILGCEETGEAIVIDPGYEADRISSLLEKYKLKPKYLVHTHAHFDHLGATDPLYQKSKADVCLHPEDLFLYENVAMQCGLFGFPTLTVPKLTQHLKEGDQLCFGKHKLQVIHTPGHTPGSVTFHLEKEGSPWLFTGDTLFLQSIGRTDLWGGDYSTIIKSIQNKILPFQEETIVFPGHGPQTTVGQEKDSNPFLQS